MSESDITQVSQEEESTENRGGSSLVVSLARQLVQALEGGAGSQGADVTRAVPSVLRTDIACTLITNSPPPPSHPAYTTPHPSYPR